MSPEMAKLLIVDDSRMIRTMLRGLLQGLGIGRIDEAPDGAAALELFHLTAYDLVLTDWNMPRLTGLELLRMIRHGPVRSDTAVLLISGDVTAGRIVEASGAGATGFVAKPFAVKLLREQVQRIISELPQVDELAQRSEGEASVEASFH